MNKLFFFKTLIIFILSNLSFFNCYADNLKSNGFALVKEYLKNLNTLEADFLQVSSDGSIKEGKIYF